MTIHECTCSIIIIVVTINRHCKRSHLSRGYMKFIDQYIIVADYDTLDRGHIYKEVRIVQ